MIKDFYTPFWMSILNNTESYFIDRNKGIYNCFVNDIKGYDYKFLIDMEQVPFPSNIFLKSN